MLPVEYVVILTVLIMIGLFGIIWWGTCINHGKRKRRDMKRPSATSSSDIHSEIHKLAEEIDNLKSRLSMHVSQKQIKDKEYFIALAKVIKEKEKRLQEYREIVAKRRLAEEMEDESRRSKCFQTTVHASMKDSAKISVKARLGQ